MNQLEYWFDKLKLGGSTDATPIKQKFQEMMLQNGALTQRGTAVFNAIWGNSGLRESLFPQTENLSNEDLLLIKASVKTSFETNLNQLTYNFYEFIKVK